MSANLSLPWSVDDVVVPDSDGYPLVVIWGAEGEGHGRIAEVYAECGPDEPTDYARHIVLAANNHDALVAALRECIDRLLSGLARMRRVSR